MSDLISRSALLEQIKEAQVKLESNKDSVWERNKPYYKGLAWAHRLILDSEAVDAVEVVRCRKCKHFVQGDPYDPCECMKWTVKWGVAYSNPDDFCSYGERKDDG